MGFSNRDYVQDGGQYDGPVFGGDVPATKWLLITTIVVFVLQSILIHTSRPVTRSGFALDDTPVRVVSQPQGIELSQPLRTSYVEEWFSLIPYKVAQGQIWRVLSYAFCHERQNAIALVVNMVMLWYLGSALERMYGSRELLAFYLAASIVCGGIFTAFGMALPLPYALMGANASVMALLALYATHFPRQEVLFAWIIPLQIRVILIIYVALDAYTILQAYQGQTAWVTVAYLSHLWGVAFGYLYRRFDLRLAGAFELFDARAMQRALRRATSGRRLKVYHPEPAASNLDEQVDAILAKIHEQGSESLSERERAILQRASEQAKRRQ